MLSLAATTELRPLLFGSTAFAIFAAWSLGADLSVAAEPDAKTPPVDFARQIQPIFAAHCHQCHGSDKHEGGLRLNARASALAGGDSGQKTIVPADPAASRLVKVISGADPELAMPPEDEGKPLSAEQIALVTRWVREGANWPGDLDASSDKPAHWAWRKPVKAALPSVRQSNWPRHALDYFVLAGIESAGLAPAAEADRHALIRRVYLDLVGLPPSLDQVDTFISDKRPDAYERMVERALADPAFGERWARVWLDLARYADSKGYGSDPLRTIWRYRDWVIEAFNRNLPYDRFTIEQLAGDLLPAATSEQLLATAFHRNTMANDEGGTDDEEFRVAAVKDRIETTMQVWMGLTMGCAKCHSHKFDPITQREYYQAYAFFDQTEDADRGDEEPTLSSPTRLESASIADRRAQIAALERQIASPPPNLAAEVAAWEESIRKQRARWVPLEPRQVTADGEATFQILPDKSVLVSGTLPQAVNYEIVCESALPAVTALHLESLPHDSLPQGGPGRAADGSFVLSELAAFVAPASTAPLAARFVRIELPGEKRILSLAEVQAFDGDNNVAPQGKATQSSTFFQAPAELAIDNTTEGDFDAKSVTHTAEEANPWWELDLGRTAPLSRIVVWNRTGHDLEDRLKDFRITVLDENRKPLWQARVAEAPRPSTPLELNAPIKLEFASATADVAAEGSPASAAIDGDAGPKSGWRAGGEAGKPHEIVVVTKSQLEMTRPATIKIKLTQSHGGTAAFGRFRLSAVADAPVPEMLPHRINEILAIEPQHRSVPQRDEVIRYYWAHSAATEPARGQIAALQAHIKEIEKQIPPLRSCASWPRRSGASRA
jgi:mono/diheme cytochrome c family protein